MRRRSGSAPETPVACVLGDIDLVTPLGLAGIPAAVVAERGDPARHSRFAREAIERLDHWNQQGQFVDRLLAWAQRQDAPPVLFYQTDGDLLMVSRHRERLARSFRFVLADARLVEDLEDKLCFQMIAGGLGLRVPPSRRLTREDATAVRDLGFPLVVKWVRRGPTPWLRPDVKAVRVDSPQELEAVLPRLEEANLEALAQKLIPGPERRIESYHAYADRGGGIVAEFTGAKLRTYPKEFGYTTALTLTDAHDVLDEGRQVVDALELTGVVKVDFKRDPSGSLWLLEVNPRFNLWHHAGAVAGVNIPALVYADLTGESRPEGRRARPGVTWCYPFEDRWAAQDEGLSTREWLRFTLRANARSSASLKDPKPLVLGELLSRTRGKITELLRRARRSP